jgi:hypothetical protein
MERALAALTARAQHLDAQSAAAPGPRALEATARRDDVPAPPTDWREVGVPEIVAARCDGSPARLLFVDRPGSPARGREVLRRRGTARSARRARQRIQQRAPRDRQKRRHRPGGGAVSSRRSSARRSRAPRSAVISRRHRARATAMRRRRWPARFRRPGRATRTSASPRAAGAGNWRSEPTRRSAPRPCTTRPPAHQQRCSPRIQGNPEKIGAIFVPNPGVHLDRRLAATPC